MIGKSESCFLIWVSECFWCIVVFKRVNLDRFIEVDFLIFVFGVFCYFIEYDLFDFIGWV